MWARFASMCDSGPCHASLCCRSVDGHPLPIDELKGIKPVESIDLSGKGLNIASAIIIGACIAGNAHLRELKCAQLFKLGGSVIAGAVAQLEPLIVCPWQLGRQHALRCNPKWHRHIHHRGHHRALRGPQAE